MPADGASMKIQGMKELGRKFGMLNERQQARVIKGGMRAGARVILKDAKRRVKAIAFRTGSLYKSLGLKLRVRRGRLEAIVGNTKKGGSHAHLVEKGSVARTRASGGSTGTMPATPFLRPAFDERQREVIKEVGSALHKQIDKAVRAR